MRSEYIFFVYFIFMILETNFDIGSLIAPVFLGFVMLDVIINHNKLVIKKLPKARGQGTALRAYYFLIAAQIVMTILIAPFNYTTYMYDSVKAFVATTILPLLVIIYFIPHIDIRKFLELLRGVGLAVGCLGVVETLTRRYVLSVFGIIGMGEFYTYAGTSNFRTLLFFMHPGVTAVFMVMAVIILLHMPFKKKIYQYIGHISLAVSIYGTKTRMMWLAYAIILAIYIIRKSDFLLKDRRIKKRVIFSVLGFAIIVSIGIVVFWDKVSAFTEQMLEYLYLVFDSSNVYVSRVIRTENLWNAVRYIFEDPIRLFYGGGLGYSNLFSANNGVTLYYGEVWNGGVDNQYVVFLLEIGVWGLIPFLICLVTSLIKYFKTTDFVTKIGCMFILLIGLGSISFSAMGWRVPVFILQMGMFIVVYAKGKGDALV